MSYPGPYASSYPPPAPARRRHRRWPWVLLAVVVVLVALLVIADRVIRNVAENKAADALQQSQNLPSKPSVSFAGFPFLTQLATGNFDEVTVTAQGIDVGESASLHIATVTVHLHDVTAKENYHVFHAATADADATVAFPDLSRTLQASVSYAGAQRVRAHDMVTVEGQTYTGTVTAGVRASSAGGIAFVRPTVRTGGQQLPAAASEALAGLLARRISLTGLPFDVRVDGVDVTPAGLVLHLAGSDLTYQRS